MGPRTRFPVPAVGGSGARRRTGARARSSSPSASASGAGSRRSWTLELLAEDLRYALETILWYAAPAPGMRRPSRRYVGWCSSRRRERPCGPSTNDLDLRRAGNACSPAERFVGADYRTIVMHASQYIAELLNNGPTRSAEPSCAAARTWASPSLLGAWRLGAHPGTLADVLPERGIGLGRRGGDRHLQGGDLPTRVRRPGLAAAGLHPRRAQATRGIGASWTRGANGDDGRRS